MAFRGHFLCRPPSRLKLWSVCGRFPAKLGPKTTVNGLGSKRTRSNNKYTDEPSLWNPQPGWAASPRTRAGGSRSDRPTLCFDHGSNVFLFPALPRNKNTYIYFRPLGGPPPREPPVWGAAAPQPPRGGFGGRQPPNPGGGGGRELPRERKTILNTGQRPATFTGSARPQKRGAIKYIRLQSLLPERGR